MKIKKKLWKKLEKAFIELDKHNRIAENEASEVDELILYVKDLVTLINTKENNP